jgi:uncharacterized membrane protein YkvA (DUF1232 family)
MISDQSSAWPDDDRSSEPVTTVDEGKLVSDERLVRERFWDKLRKALGEIAVVEDFLSAYYCAMDNRTPTYVRGILLGALAYFIVPSDAIPDFLAVLGFTDDAAVLAAAISAVHENIRPEHRRSAREFLESNVEEGS